MANTYRVVIKKKTENYILTTIYVVANTFGEAEVKAWIKAKNELHNTWTLNNNSHFYIYKVD